MIWKNFFHLLFLNIIIRTENRTETGIWCRERERWHFVSSLQGGRVSEKRLGVSTLQAAEPPYGSMK